ncbi:Tyrosine--tRNA ligase [compost metagenome]
MVEYLEVYTDLSDKEISDIEKKVESEPMESKKTLAKEIVKRYHGEEVAQYEKKWFEQTFSKKEVPESIEEVAIYETSLNAIEFVSLLLEGKQSNSEIRRLITQGAVKIDDIKVVNPNETINVKNGAIVKIGKRTWFRVLSSN